MKPEKKTFCRKERKKRGLKRKREKTNFKAVNKKDRGKQNFLLKSKFFFLIFQNQREISFKIQEVQYNVTERKPE